MSQGNVVSVSVSHKLLALAGKTFGRNRLNILIYHQVFAERDTMRPSEPTAAEFDWQMKLIGEYYTPLSLDEALKGLDSNSLPNNAICVTFDDGYLNNLTVAEPILAKYNIPATIYVATAFSDGVNMFNDRILDLIEDEKFSDFDLTSVELGRVEVSDSASRIALAHRLIGKLKYLHFDDRMTRVDQIYQDNNASEYPARMMSVKDIKSLAETGVEIGAHTRDHPILRTLTLDAQQQQLMDAKQTLENIVNEPIKHFAYPNGKLNDDYSTETVELVKSVGFASAVSTHWGVSDSTSDQYQLKRFTPWDSSELKFHLRLRLNQLGFIQ